MSGGNIANNFGSFDVVFEKGQGSTVYDINGKKYIDFLAGIAVNCLGHNHPSLVKAISEQATKQIHISNYYLHLLVKLLLLKNYILMKIQKFLQ